MGDIDVLDACENESSFGGATGVGVNGGCELLDAEVKFHEIGEDELESGAVGGPVEPQRQGPWL